MGPAGEVETEEGRLDEQRWWGVHMGDQLSSSLSHAGSVGSATSSATVAGAAARKIRLTVEAGLGKAAGGAGRQQGARHAAQQRVHALWAEGPHCKGGKNVCGTGTGELGC